MTRLILNADDLGLTPGVNRSILELYHGGALTSATLMATASHTPEAVAIVRQSGLSVGCHIVLVDGQPALPHERIPALAPRSGLFRTELGAFFLDLARGAIPEMEIEMEAVAQIRCLQNAGITVTHLDTHKHTHMFPRVLRPLLRAAILCGVRAVRNPFEPDWALDATAHGPILRRMEIRLLRAGRSEFLRLVQQAGMITTDGTIGVLATGSLDTEALEHLLNATPAGTWELVCHPGYIDDDLSKLQTRLRESRAIEHSALGKAVPQFLSRHPEIAAINFGQICEPIA